MNKLNRILWSVCCLVAVVLCGACSDNEEAADGNKIWHTYKVAVVLPMDGGLDVHWKRTLAMAANNLQAAFGKQAEGIRLEYEYHDENSSDIGG